MVPRVVPSASTQIVRVCCPLTFMLDALLTHRNAGDKAVIGALSCLAAPVPILQARPVSRAGEGQMSIDYEAEYNNRARVPEHPQIFARWVEEAAAYRERMKTEEN